MIKVTSSEARKDFAGMVRRARKGARYLIHKHNKGIAAIVSVEDLALLEVIERRRDLKAARQALEEIEREGTIPWDQAKAELGLWQVAIGPEPRYQLEIAPSALKQLSSLPRKIQERIAAGIDALRFEPRPHGVKKLSGPFHK